MDLHAWISQQVDRVEAAARDADGPLEEQLSWCEVEVPGAQPFLAMLTPDAVLRRCEADRRILARHCVDISEADSPMYATACKGCERWGEFDYPNTENVNDCPELLDLAHAHDINEEILAGLDRPQPPEPKPSTGPRIGHCLATSPITTSDVPEALRGPRWKS